MPLGIGGPSRASLLSLAESLAGRLLPPRVFFDDSAVLCARLIKRRPTGHWHRFVTQRDLGLGSGEEKGRSFPPLSDPAKMRVVRDDQGCRSAAPAFSFSPQVDRLSTTISRPRFLPDYWLLSFSYVSRSVSALRTPTRQRSTRRYANAKKSVKFPTKKGRPIPSPRLPL